MCVCGGGCCLCLKEGGDTEGVWGITYGMMLHGVLGGFSSDRQEGKKGRGEEGGE